jgi:hypothetical protein
VDILQKLPGCLRRIGGDGGHSQWGMVDRPSFVSAGREGRPNSDNFRIYSGWNAHGVIEFGANVSVSAARNAWQY